MPPIPRPDEPEGLEIVPSEAAELPPVVEEPEVLPYKISFASYKPEECEIDGMRKSNAAVALKIVRDIGTNYRGPKSSPSRFIDDVKKIVGTGDYQRICNGLAEEIEVQEIKFTRERRKEPENSVDLRIFFYTVDTERTFYVLAIRQSHYNLDH